ncbi:hypothetical protein HYU12_00640 [Candidatus Woesearchaeota archaeon]|nr:hypothetical protein [Candidatus Woesearchaeota archaeon]
MSEGLFEEMQYEEGDEEILDELEQKRKAARRSFSSVINKHKLSRYELDEVML